MEILLPQMRLRDLWNVKASWKIISLGPGFYQFNFHIKEDFSFIWYARSQNLKPILFKLQRWTSDFNPTKQKITDVQAWVRVYELEWEYWDDTIFSETAQCIEAVIRIDKATLVGDFKAIARYGFIYYPT